MEPYHTASLRSSSGGHAVSQVEGICDAKKSIQTCACRSRCRRSQGQEEAELETTPSQAQAPSHGAMAPPALEDPHALVKNHLLGTGCLHSSIRGHGRGYHDPAPRGRRGGRDTPAPSVLSWWCSAVSLQSQQFTQRVAAEDSEIPPSCLTPNSDLRLTSKFKELKGSFKTGLGHGKGKSSGSGIWENCMEFKLAPEFDRRPQRSLTDPCQVPRPPLQESLMACTSLPPPGLWLGRVGSLLQQQPSLHKPPSI